MPIFFSSTTFHILTHSSIISLCLLSKVRNVALTYCSFERIMAPSLPAVRTFIPYIIQTRLRKYLQNCMDQNTSYEADTHSVSREISRLLRNKKVYYNVHNSHSQNLSLSHFDTLTPYFFLDLHSAAQSNGAKTYQNNTGYDTIFILKITQNNTRCNGYTYYSVYKNTGNIWKIDPQG